MRSRMPLTKRPESVVPKRFASSIASLIAALGGVGISAGGDLPPDALTTLTPLAGVIWWGDAATARALESALSARDGKIIALITGQPDRAHACHERHVCIDTTAAGGNAALLAEVGGPART